MASQAQLEEWIAAEKAKLAILRAEYDRLTGDNATQADEATAKILRRTELVPTQQLLAGLEIQLANLLQIPDTEPIQQVEITTNFIIDPTGLDLGPEIPNRIIAQKPIVSGIPDNLPDVPIIQSSDPLTPPVIPGFDPFEPVGNTIQNYKPPNYEADPNVLLNNEPAGNSNIQHYTPTHVPSSYDNENVFDPRGDNDENNANNIPGLQGPTNDARAQETTQDTENKKTQDDWRVRLSLAPSSTYLYNAKPAGILEYLKATNGVVFPYVPQIQVTYAANYETSDIVHSNYKLVQYKNSAVDQISITGDFTAQDTYEANYMLAVIHFFKSVTKMFYGRDQIPKPGTPPPLCYLSGLGDFQFDNHPLVVSSFNYSLPNDVDYIRASGPTLMPGVNSSAYNAKGSEMSTSERRLQGGPNPPNVGAIKSDPNWRNTNTNIQPTYVPTKLQITITAFPMVTRNDISNRFSVRDYATGALLQGSKNKGGGIW
jgi:hypothetical protein